MHRPVSFAFILTLTLGTAAGPVLAGGPAGAAPQPEATRARPPLAEQAALLSSGTRAQRVQAARALAAAGLDGVALAARSATDAASVRQLRWSVRETLARSIEAGDLASAQALLEALAAGGDPTAVRELAAFIALSGRESALEAPVLAAWTARARGDRETARDLAAKTPDAADDLLGGIYLETGDWAALARWAAARVDGTEAGLRATGLAALAFGLAGESREAEALVNRLSAHAESHPDDARLVAAILLLVERPGAAAPLLERAGELGVAFDLLADERRHADAFALAARGFESPEDAAKGALSSLELKVARLRAHLADGSGAREAMDAYEQRLRDEGQAPDAAAGRTVLHEKRLGLGADALARAAEALEAPDARPDRVLGPLFCAQRDEAEAAWAWTASAHPELPAAEALGRVVALLDPKADDEATLRRVLAETPATVAERPASEKTRILRGLVRLAERRGQLERAEGLAREWAKTSGQQQAWTVLGERLEDLGRWSDAADAHRQAWAVSPVEPAPLALAARALERAGRAAAAEELHERASLVALGDDSRRWRLAQALSRVGESERADEQREALLRTADPAGWYHGATLRTLGARAGCAGDAATAVARYDAARAQALLGDRTLSPAVAASLMRASRDALVRQAVLTDRPELALERLEPAIAPWLSDPDRTAEAVRSLEAAGLDAEADWLSVRVLDRLDEVAGDFPASAAAHNTFAWFAARTGRDLDDARRAAERAIELNPQAAGYVDTLAEVAFQQGETQEAMALIARAIELRPDREYYRLQLERFVAGDPGTAPPLER